MSEPGRLRRALVLSMFLVFLLGYAAGTTRAVLTGTTKPVETAITETIVVPMNAFSAYVFTLATGEALVYSVEVTDGSPIDIYLVPSVGLTKYTTGSSSTFDRYQEFPNQRTVSGSLPEVTGEVVVVLDNTNVPVAQPTGNVSALVALSKTSNIVLGGFLLIACGAGALAAAAIIFAVRRRRARTGGLAYGGEVESGAEEEAGSLPLTTEPGPPLEPPRE